MSITSPTLPTDSGIIHSAKQFSDNLTLDLTDEEITQAFGIITAVSKKWQQRFRYEFNDMASYTKLNMSQSVEKAARLIDQFEDELITNLAERMDLIATVDMAPVFEGEPPVVELVGALPSHYSAKYGMDHERKEHNVKMANARGEAFLGEKEILNPNTARKKSIKSERQRKAK